MKNANLCNSQCLCLYTLIDFVYIQSVSNYEFLHCIFEYVAEKYALVVMNYQGFGKNT